jgi:pregnancy-associated plasma protein-A
LERQRGRRPALAAVAAIVFALMTAGTAVAQPGPAPGAEHCSAFAGLPTSVGAGLNAGAAGARAGAREPSAWKNPPIEEAPAGGFAATIEVHFHVFTDGTTGRLSEQQLLEQIAVMNTDFSGGEGGYDTGFRFSYGGVDYTDNASWFYELDGNTSIERRAKDATHTGDASDLNVWTTNGPTYLGFATFPSWYKRSPQLDGVVLDYKSFPGGPYGSQYSLGKTATHEVGHWLGLLHTFQGACNAKGDYVADTPPEAVPTTGCPEGKDTCREPGLDPIHNYMDYSWDSCYSQFTPGQAARMRAQWSWFRADGGTAVGNV